MKGSLWITKHPPYDFRGDFGSGEGLYCEAVSLFVVMRGAYLGKGGHFLPPPPLRVFSRGMGPLGALRDHEGGFHPLSCIFTPSTCRVKS